MVRQILPVPGPITSYWLSEPHPYADLQSTPQLPERCDVAVVYRREVEGSSVLLVFCSASTSVSVSLSFQIPKEFD